MRPPPAPSGSSASNAVTPLPPGHHSACDCPHHHPPGDTETAARDPGECTEGGKKKKTTTTTKKTKMKTSRPREDSEHGSRPAAAGGGGEGEGVVLPHFPDRPPTQSLLGLGQDGPCCCCCCCWRHVLHGTCPGNAALGPWGGCQLTSAGGGRGDVIPDTLCSDVSKDGRRVAEAALSQALLPGGTQPARSKDRPSPQGGARGDGGAGGPLKDKLSTPRDVRPRDVVVRPGDVRRSDVRRSDVFDRLSSQDPPYVFHHLGDVKGYMSEYRERCTVGRVCRKARHRPVLGVDVPDPYVCRKKKPCPGPARLPVCPSKMAARSRDSEGASPHSGSTCSGKDNSTAARSVPNLAPVRQIAPPAGERPSVTSPPLAVPPEPTWPPSQSAALPSEAPPTNPPLPESRTEDQVGSTREDQVGFTREDQVGSRTEHWLPGITQKDVWERKGKRDLRFQKDGFLNISLARQVYEGKVSLSQRRDPHPGPAQGGESQKLSGAKRSRSVDFRPDDGKSKAWGRGGPQGRLLNLKLLSLDNLPAALEDAEKAGDSSWKFSRHTALPKILDPLMTWDRLPQAAKQDYWGPIQPNTDSSQQRQQRVLNGQVTDNSHSTSKDKAQLKSTQEKERVLHLVSSQEQTETGFRKTTTTTIPCPDSSQGIGKEVKQEKELKMRGQDSSTNNPDLTPDPAQSADMMGVRGRTILDAESLGQSHRAKAERLAANSVTKETVHVKVANSQISPLNPHLPQKRGECFPAKQFKRLTTFLKPSPSRRTLGVAAKEEKEGRAARRLSKEGRLPLSTIDSASLVVKGGAFVDGRSPQGGRRENMGETGQGRGEGRGRESGGDSDGDLLPVSYPLQKKG
ncbi:hypothetical protein ACOMHN_045825 [Nucella lapillus]